MLELVHVVNEVSMANWEESVPEMDMADGLGSVMLLNPTFTREKAFVETTPGFAWIAVKLESVRASVGGKDALQSFSAMVAKFGVPSPVTMS